jgi:hypothetical protein
MYRFKANALVAARSAASGNTQAAGPANRRRQEVLTYSQKRLGWSQSTEFTVVGEIDLRPWARGPSPVWLPLRDGLGKFFDSKILNEQLPARKQYEGWCHSLKVTPPLVGTLTICLPSGSVDRYGVRAVREEVRYFGDYSIPKNFVTPERAEIIGHTLVRKVYEPMADTTSVESLFDYEAAVESMKDNQKSQSCSGCANNLKRMKFLESVVRDGAFVLENGGYWLFEVAENVQYFRNGLDGAPALPSHTVVVKVEGNGTACIVARGTAGYFRPLLSEVRFIVGGNGVVTERDLKKADWDTPCRLRTAPLEVYKQ